MPSATLPPQKELPVPAREVKWAPEVNLATNPQLATTVIAQTSHLHSEWQICKKT